MRICNIYIYMRIHIYNKSYSNNHRIIIYIYMYRGVQYCYFLLEFNIYNRNIIFIFICIHTQLINYRPSLSPHCGVQTLFFFVCLPFVPTYSFPYYNLRAINGVFYRSALVFCGKKELHLSLFEKGVVEFIRNISKESTMHFSRTHDLNILYRDRSPFILQNIHYSLAAFG